MQTVKKNAVTCGDCGLIAHSRCRADAPPTCGLRAQLLQFVNSPALDSPQALELIRQFTPSTTPLPEPGTPSADGHGGADGPAHPPTAFRMFNAFRRSRSSLSPEPLSPRSNSQEGSNESVVTPAPASPAQSRRPALLLKPERLRPRPLSTGESSDGTPPNRSSLRSAYTGGSVDLSDESYSQAHSQAHSHSHSRSPAPVPSARSRPQAIPRSRYSGGGHRPSAVGAGSDEGAGTGASTAAEDQDQDQDQDLETETEADHYAGASRYSVAASAADSALADPRRVSMFAGSSVAHGTEESVGVAGYNAEEMERAHTRRRARRQGQKAAERDKGCVVQ